MAGEQLPQVTVRTSLETVARAVAEQVPRPNIVPIVTTILADLITPPLAYLKLTRNATRSFLFESVTGGEQIGRYTFLGADPFEVIETGPGYGGEVDPITVLEERLSRYTVAAVPNVPAFSGGAIGYVGYDCVRYFEPKTLRSLKDPLGIPEACFMLFDTVVVFDNLLQVVTIVSHVHVPPEGGLSDDTLEKAYAQACAKIKSVSDLLHSRETVEPKQEQIQLGHEFTSNIGQEGYERHVRDLREKIKEGHIIQAVPSQRIARPTSLHPFNIYRQLRTMNPSPYMFYLNCDKFQLVGASPELLVKEEDGRIITHPIAGTVARGKTLEEDEKLAKQLRESEKDRAEHIMLVDLARNDISRVCDPLTTRVDRLMTVERYSHVSHLVSQVSGVLRQGLSRFDAFRSIFPAGTVSGAPKVRAMELIAELEGERRGVYAGAVGRWGFDRNSFDTCIAIRTMTVRDGVVYLQAGGGIVYDSDPHEEYIETINKLKANIKCIEKAEAYHAKYQQEKVVELL